MLFCKGRKAYYTKKYKQLFKKEKKKKAQIKDDFFSSIKKMVIPLTLLFMCHIFRQQSFTAEFEPNFPY